MRLALAVLSLVACATAPEAAGAQLLDARAGNPVFLEAMTLQLARQLELPGAKPHVVELLKDGEGAPRVREAVQMFPAEVEALVVSGEWEPSDLKEWKWLTLMALNEELYGAMPVSLAKAVELEDCAAKYIAAGLIYDGGDRTKSVVAAGFKHADPNHRAYTALAVSIHPGTDWMDELRGQAKDEHPWARANALAALVRLGEASGTKDSLGALGIRSGEGVSVVPFLVEALERAAPDAEVGSLIVSALAAMGEDPLDVTGAGVLAVSILHPVGARTKTPSVDELRRVTPTIASLRPERQRCIRALARLGTPEDLAALASMAAQPPAEMADLKADLELAVALAAAGHPVVKDLIQQAVWTLPWNQAVLAAGCAIEGYGVDEVAGWAASAAPSTPMESIRRLGWSLGRFRGAAGVEAVRRAAGSSAPELQAAVLGATYRPD